MNVIHLKTEKNFSDLLILRQAVLPLFFYNFLTSFQFATVAQMGEKNDWRPLRDLNPCLHRERVVS